MRIAIFNKNLTESTFLKNTIYTFSNYKKVELAVKIFTDITQLLREYNDFSLIFISYDTPYGITLANQFFKANVNKPVIITAKDVSFAIDAFKINAYNFLKVPLNQSELFNVLNNFYNSYFSETLLLNIGFENICISTEEIIYIEANNQHCTIHLKDDCIYYKKTMACVVNALPQDIFLKISRSFVVNSNYVAKFNSETITLKNGTTLHPSRHFYKNFKCDYLRTQCPIIV